MRRILELTFSLDDDNDKRHPLYIQLYNYIRREIQKGKILPGSKLPSQRKLANYLQVSRNTIDKAYQQLMAEGYIESQERKGLFVVDFKNSGFFLQDSSPEVERENVKKPQAGQGKPISIDFSHGKVDINHFPYHVWRKLTVESLYADQGQYLLMGDPQGEPGLRKQIARYLYHSRGVQCSYDQIVIGAGTQYILSLLCKIVGENGSIGVEEPGFHRSRFVFKDNGLEVVPIPLDEKGINIQELSRKNPGLAYITPSHQFPCGVIMPMSRRMEMIEWAQTNGGWIIEDDYDGEFRYLGRPIPSLQSLDINKRVIYLGTFSKSLLPSIRVSYMVLPPELLRNYQEKCAVYKQTVSRLHQHTLELFMEQGHWEKHLNRIRNLYKKKHGVLLSSIKNVFSEKEIVEIIGADSGMHILLKVQNGMNEQELIETAADVGVKVYPTSIYFVNSSMSADGTVLLGFGGLDEKEIQQGIKGLRQAWFINNEIVS